MLSGEPRRHKLIMDLSLASETPVNFFFPLSVGVNSSALWLHDFVLRSIVMSINHDTLWCAHTSNIFPFYVSFRLSCLFPEQLGSLRDCVASCRLQKHWEYFADLVWILSDESDVFENHKFHQKLWHETWTISNHSNQKLRLDASWQSTQSIASVTST